MLNIYIYKLNKKHSVLRSVCNLKNVKPAAHAFDKYLFLVKKLKKRDKKCFKKLVNPFLNGYKKLQILRCSRVPYIFDNGNNKNIRIINQVG